MGSPTKRADILAAARDRFLGDGFDGTSVDVIAATAGVSKRTVYDYFGDKQTLFTAVLDGCAASLMATIVAALDDYLTTVSNLEDALVNFSERIISTTMTSSDYAALTRLSSTEAARQSSINLDRWFTSEPEDTMAARFAELDQAGLLEAPNPRLAADHFVALALGTALDAQRHPDKNHPGAVTQSIVDGVRAFLRAYAPR